MSTSLDPGALSLMSLSSVSRGDTASLTRLKCQANDTLVSALPPPIIQPSASSSTARNIATKLVRIVSPNNSNRNLKHDSDQVSDIEIQGGS